MSSGSGQPHSGGGEPFECGSEAPRVPEPRDPPGPGPFGPPPAEDGDGESKGGTSPPGGSRNDPDHGALRSLLGAWALHACSHEETEIVERHLPECTSCAGEARRLRSAVRWLSPDDPLELDPLLRTRVLEDCLDRRPARVPVPEWAAPYAAETARLDALLRSLGDDEWDTAVTLVWHTGSRDLTLCGVLAHLGCVDGLLATTLGLVDPLGDNAPHGLLERTNAATERCRRHPPAFVRNKWRTQTQSIVSTVSLAGEDAADLPVDYGGAFTLPMRDAFLDRAFECWIHTGDIARAVDYPHEPPAPPHLGAMIDLAARLLPHAVAERRRQGLGASPGRLVEAGRPGRTIRLEVEGPGGGDWYVPLDSPAAVASPEDSVAHVALDGVEFCLLVAGHRDPEEMAIGVLGDKDAVRDVLYAAASMSRL